MATKYIVNMIDADTGEVLERCYDDEVFDTEEDAEDYAREMRSCTTAGADVLKLSRPLDYEEEFGIQSEVDFVVEEIED